MKHADIFEAKVLFISTKGKVNFSKTPSRGKIMRPIHLLLLNEIESRSRTELLLALSRGLASLNRLSGLGVLAALMFCESERQIVLHHHARSLKSISTDLSSRRPTFSPAKLRRSYSLEFSFCAAPSGSPSRGRPCAGTRTPCRGSCAAPRGSATARKRSFTNDHRAAQPVGVPRARSRS